MLQVMIKPFTQDLLSNDSNWVAEFFLHIIQKQMEILLKVTLINFDSYNSGIIKPVLFCNISNEYTLQC